MHYGTFCGSKDEALEPLVLLREALQKQDLRWITKDTSIWEEVGLGPLMSAVLCLCYVRPSPTNKCAATKYGHTKKLNITVDQQSTCLCFSKTSYIDD